MQIQSQDFAAGQHIPGDCTCDGKDLSPQLSWSDFPAETKSFAISCMDPDALGGNWIHWLVVGIPPYVNTFVKGMNMDGHGIELANDFGKTSYGGPCPPEGEHRYVFTVYALDTMELPGITKENFVDLVEKHSLDQAELTGLYSRRF
jgi:Raf kinase inhibitor-like YbhB/YbcL family protein